MCGRRKPLNHIINGIDQPSNNHVLMDKAAEGVGRRGWSWHQLWGERRWAVGWEQGRCLAEDRAFETDYWEFLSSAILSKSTSALYRDMCLSGLAAVAVSNLPPLLLLLLFIYFWISGRNEGLEKQERHLKLCAACEWQNWTRGSSSNANIIKKGGLSGPGSTRGEKICAAPR